jgi:hypothetical protein
MQTKASGYAAQLRQELGVRNRQWAWGRAHVESYGNPPVIVYAPENGRHGNFFDPAYQAIAAHPEWLRRFNKIHAQGRSLPKAESGRRWRELDSSMSSDALLMNIFCTPGVADSPALLRALGVDAPETPIFGWKARVPLANGRFDRTEVDLRLGSLLIEAKLTETDFQTREAAVMEAYRDFDAVFYRDLLPRVELVTTRRKAPAEFPEDYSQEFESLVDQEAGSHASAAAREAAFLWQIETPPAPQPAPAPPTVSAYASYQLIRNVLAAHAAGCGFCVVHDQRRPDLREAWVQVMAAARSADLRVRLAVLTWQELAALLPSALQDFLDLKYGIVAPDRIPTLPVESGA